MSFLCDLCFVPVKTNSLYCGVQSKSRRKALPLCLQSWDEVQRHFPPCWEPMWMILRWCWTSKPHLWAGLQCVCCPGIVSREGSDFPHVLICRSVSLLRASLACLPRAGCEGGNGAWRSSRKDALDTSCGFAEALQSGQGLSIHEPCGSTDLDRSLQRAAPRLEDSQVWSEEPTWRGWVSFLPAGVAAQQIQPEGGCFPRTRSGLTGSARAGWGHFCPTSRGLSGEGPWSGQPVSGLPKCGLQSPDR